MANFYLPDDALNIFHFSGTWGKTHICKYKVDEPTPKKNKEMLSSPKMKIHQFNVPEGKGKNTKVLFYVDQVQSFEYFSFVSQRHHDV